MSVIINALRVLFLSMAQKNFSWDKERSDSKDKASQRQVSCRGLCLAYLLLVFHAPLLWTTASSAAQPALPVAFWAACLTCPTKYRLE